MSPTVLIVIAALAAVFVLWLILSPSLDKAVNAAVTTKNIDGVVTAISKKNGGTRLTAYNHAIRRMWDTYERGLAASLVCKLAENHHTERIAQYWIKQVLTAEPAVARQMFSKDFLDTYYLPELAARCGPTSS